MNKFKLFGELLIMGVAALNCAVPRNKPLVDPFPLKFPLVEAGTIDIEGTVVGQPRAQGGIVYYATREGYITAVVASSRGVLWRFKADHTISVSPELGEGRILLRDDGNVLYVLDGKGLLVLKKQVDEPVTSAAREVDGRIYFGTSSGKAMALDLSADGAHAWEYKTAAAISSGPVFGGDIVIFGAADGRLIALDHAGKRVWEFEAQGKIAVAPAVAGERLYFGTEERFLYCLDAASGRKKWSRRLQGAPLHPVLVQGGRLALAASNSVVYFISGRGGSILSWESVPSRIVHEAAPAGPLVLISSAGHLLVAYDIATGKRVGQHIASGHLVAGALWVSPAVVLVVEDEGSGRQSLVFLRLQPSSSAAAAKI